MPPFDPFTHYGQAAILVLAALEERNRTGTKEDTVSHIKNREYFAFKNEDHESYRSQIGTEPRWINVLSSGREECLKRGWMSGRGETDAWGVTNEGVQFLNRVRQKLKEDKKSLRRFYFWSPVFKKRMCPAYEQGKDDWEGPSSRYRDSPPDLSDLF